MIKKYSAYLSLDGEIKGDGFSLDGKMFMLSSLETKEEKKTYRTVLDEKGNVIDYLDVRIEGYANTFNLDRGDEQVIPGAFAEHLEEYLSNAVLQADHDRGTYFNSGQVTSAYEDNTGLKISALLSNSPSERMKDLRFKVVEGSVKTLSIGGRFHGKVVNSGEKTIVFLHKIELREISVVTVPMNKESMFEVKEDSASQPQTKQSVENMRFVMSEDEPEPLVVNVDGEKFVLNMESKGEDYGKRN
jgi:HK97 family phage prohead protease